ncbi:MAG: conjugal transfer protein TraF, partial [Alistipes sp.]|nr:conjugal transfer protein TraF [Alistipes sp.]
KNFSIGAAAKYYCGDIQRTYRTAVLENITGGGLITDATGVETYSISRFQAQVGIQWSPISDRKRNLTLGAAYDIGGDLSPEVNTTVKTGDVFTSVAGDDTERLALKLPHQITAGVYYQTLRLSLGADYTYCDWRSGNSRLVERSSAGFDVTYRNTHAVKLGFEYTPNRNDVRNVLKRWSYRAGVRYGSYCQSFGGVGVDEYAVTLGIGIPLRTLGSVLGASSVNLGVEVGRRGGFDRINEQIGMVRQTYFKFAVGVTLFGDYWFVRPKYD